MPGRIVRVRWRSFAVPFRATLRAAHGSQADREGLIVEISTDDGLTGLGEASPLPSYAGGSVAEAADALETLARGIVGSDPEEAWESGVELPGVSAGSAGAARCGVETAVADLCASRQGARMSEWLAGRGGVADGEAAERIPVNGTIDAADLKDVERETNAWLEKCVTTFKVKVGMDAESDLARVGVVASMAPGAKIRIDANGAWPPGEARELLARFAGAGVVLCEQPIGRDVPGVLALTAELRREAKVAIALDESCRSVGELEAIIEGDAADAVVIKPMVSGLMEALAMVALARRTSIPVIVTTMFDTGIGTMAAVHLAAATSARPMASGLATVERLADDLVTGMPRVKGGTIAVPARKGLGVRLDERALGTYAGTIAGEVTL